MMIVKYAKVTLIKMYELIMSDKYLHHCLR